MKYIITKKQYNVINEALGVPDNIHEAAIEFYELFLDHIKSITEKQEEYEFSGNVDVTLGGKKKIKIDEYELVVRIHEIEGYDEPPQVASMGMGQSFRFDRDTLMKETEPSTTANFSIVYGVSDDWEPHQLYEEFKNNSEDHISSIAHELKHKYDKQVKRTDLIGHDAEYSAVQDMARVGIPALDNKFRRFLYYTNVAENLVRTSEVSSSMKAKNITKEQFREFLENDRTFKTLVEIKNFTYEKFIQELLNSMDGVNEFLDYLEVDTEGMSDEEKIKLVLKKYYIALTNTKIDKFDDYIEGPMDGLFKLFSFFGNVESPTDLKVKQVRNKFFNHVTKYKHNESQFYQDEIKKFHVIANQMIKKLSKLYAMTSKTSTNESIINWELHMKIKGNNSPIMSEQVAFNKSQLKRRLKSIEDLINDEINLVHSEGDSFSDEFEFADNIISWVCDKLMAMPEYEKYEYDELHDFIKEHFGDMILDEYIEDEYDDEDEDDF